MIRTGIPVSVWEQEGSTVLMTAARLLAREAEDAEPEPKTDDEIRKQWGV